MGMYMCRSESKKENQLSSSIHPHEQRRGDYLTVGVVLSTIQGSNTVLPPNIKDTS